ncbi:Mg-dependent DNase, partial [Sphingomonas sp. LH128]
RAPPPPPPPPPPPADTAAFVANLRGTTVAQLGEATTRNFFALFSKAQYA